MNNSRIYISSDKTKATLVIFWGTRSKEIIYRIKGERWVTPLEEIIKNNPKAKILKEC